MYRRSVQTAVILAAFAISTAVTYLILYPGVLGAGQIPASIPPGPEKAVAFTAVQELRYFRRDGSQEGPLSIRVQAFRGNGDYALTVSRNGDPNPTRTVVLAESKVEYVIDPAARAFLRGAARTKPNLREGCAHNPCQRLDTPVLGYEVVRIVTPLPGGMGQTEILAAPALNYFPLRTISKTAQGEIMSSEETISVQVGEPNPALFALPPQDFVESKDRKKFVEDAARLHGFGPM
ncbi:MAG: hypothetical protein K6T61_11245 [Bryobacteraceae bacterium]|nr:hypothetical protein [Bryobacteraceae bacterium]